MEFSVEMNYHVTEYAWEVYDSRESDKHRRPIAVFQYETDAMKFAILRQQEENARAA